MEKLLKLQAKLANGMGTSAADKKYIREKAAEYGIEVKNTRCKNCWHDLIVLILVNAKKLEGVEAGAEDERGVTVPAVPQLKGSLSIYGINWNGRRITQGMITLNMYRHMCAKGLGHLFEPFEDETGPGKDNV